VGSLELGRQLVVDAPEHEGRREERPQRDREDVDDVAELGSCPKKSGSRIASTNGATGLP